MLVLKSSPGNNKTPHPPKKSVTPLPPTSRTTKKLIGPINFKIGRVGLLRSSSATYVSTEVSDERGWSPRPYVLIGRSDRSYPLVGATFDPRGSEVTPSPRLTFLKLRTPTPTSLSERGDYPPLVPVP